MDGNGSVAPRERVNIVFRPAVGDAVEEVELPFSLLVLGKLSSQSRIGSLEDRKAVSVDKENFKDVLRAHDVSIDINVDNVMSEDDGQLHISLKIEEMSDFSPDSIVAQVPQMSQLLELRDALTALKGPLGNAPQFRRRLQGIIQNEETRRKLLLEFGLDEIEA